MKELNKKHKNYIIRRDDKEVCPFDRPKRGGRVGVTY